MFRATLLATVVACALSACITENMAKRLAAPQTGCRMEDLAVENLDEVMRSWEAVGCGGHWLCGPAGNAFVCTSTVTHAAYPVSAPVPLEPRRATNPDESSRKTVAVETGCALETLRVTQHLDDADATLVRVEGCGPAWLCTVTVRANCRLAQGQAAAPAAVDLTAHETASDAGVRRKPLAP